METNKKGFFKYYILGSAMIWAATIIGCALILKDQYTEISLLLSGAAVVHLGIWSSLVTQVKKQKVDVNNNG